MSSPGNMYVDVLQRGFPRPPGTMAVCYMVQSNTCEKCIDGTFSNRFALVLSAWALNNRTVFWDRILHTARRTIHHLQINSANSRKLCLKNSNARNVLPHILFTWRTNDKSLESYTNKCNPPPRTFIYIDIRNQFSTRHSPNPRGIIIISVHNII